jgi:DNA replication protein DnaC
LAITLHEAQELTKLGRLQQQLAKADPLILDELSYVSFNQAHAQLLFQVSFVVKTCFTSMAIA